MIADQLIQIASFLIPAATAVAVALINRRSKAERSNDPHPDDE